MTVPDDKINAELVALRAECARLHGQLTATRRFVLSESDRQELEMFGVARINGRQMTTDEVRAALAETGDQRDVQIADPDPGVATVLDEVEPPGMTERRERSLRRIIRRRFGVLGDDAIRVAAAAVRVQHPEWTAEQVEQGALVHLVARDAS